MFLKTTQHFQFTNTLLAALIGAIIGQISILFFNLIKKKIDLFNKKKLIQADLKNQKVILIRMETKLIELKNLFEKREIEKYEGDIFHELTKDIFESVPKLELYKIFNIKLPILVDIYESIMFLKMNNPPTIYGQYILKLNIHTSEKKNQVDHEFYCTTHIGFINMAIGQISNNLNTIREVKKKIDNLTIA